jgi:hypothetical protein
MVDDGITFTNPSRLDIKLNFQMKDTNSGTLTFDAQSTGFDQSEATKLNIVQFLGADFTYVYRCTKARINGSGDIIVGKYVASTKVLEFEFGGIDMNTIQSIELTS